MGNSLRYRVPADIDREDQLLGSLSPRQLLIAGISAIVAWLLFKLLSLLAPMPVALVLCSPIFLAVVGLLLMRRDGITGEQFVLHWVRFRRQPKTLVQAPEGIVESPRNIVGIKEKTDELQLPLIGFDEAALDLGNLGRAVVFEVGAVPFALKSTDEQRALLSTFSRFLNSIDLSVQFLIRIEPATTRSVSLQLRDHATALADAALEQAALAHADFLASLTTSSALFRRRVFVVISSRNQAGLARAQINTTISELERCVRGLGATMRVLSTAEVASVVSEEASFGRSQ
jgi:hypothetical protein